MGMAHETYQYERWDEAPYNHRMIAAMAFKGLPDGIISERSKLSVRVVRKILNHPPIAREIERMNNNVRESLVERKTNLTAMALDQLEERLATGDLKTADLIALVKDGFDRNVSTAKVTKNLHHHTKSNAPTEGDLTELRQLYSRLPDKLQHALPVHAVPVDENDEDEQDGTTETDGAGSVGQEPEQDVRGDGSDGSDARECDSGASGAWGRFGHEPGGSVEGGGSGGEGERIAQAG